MHPFGNQVFDEPEVLFRQNQDLRKRLEEESNNYKKRLESYKQAQQHQAALVSRLQAKILQYKQRCAGKIYLENIFFCFIKNFIDFSSQIWNAKKI